MMMGTGSMETMDIPSTTTSDMDMTSTASMDMDSTTTTASDMDMDMSMNTALTTDYSGYPVIFSTLSAASGASAFGIFCALFFTAFAFRGLAFLGAYVEQRVFTPTHLTDEDDDATTTSKDDDDEIKCCGPSTVVTEKSSLDSSKDNTTQRSVIAKFFAVTPQSMYRDFIRLILVFVSTMIGYALMLAVMSFVIPYFFAVILGISFGEIFFLRLSSAMNIRPAGTFCVTIH